MEVFVMIPYIHKWASNVNNPGPGGERSASFGGLGDIDLTLKYRLVEEGQSHAHRDRDVCHRFSHRPF